MGWQCSQIPSNIRIIKVGDSEVGIIDHQKILREVYSLGIDDEASLKEELLSRAKEKNYISDFSQNLYAGALLREYKDYARSRRPSGNQARKKARGQSHRLRNFLKRLLRE